ncbi:ABC transporter permease [Streptomyces sp. NBC_00239]|uniref:ABC transporter permease n=1 Tax=Streptomyces sp. NBC_00239 TaxID=2903640 RepID=UPI002E293B1E|nr:ABC transporter permease [Streptomyces sp. NBC_00239]
MAARPAARRAADSAPEPESGPAAAAGSGARRPRAVAPWVRTRLRSAPGAALAFGTLVLITAFLAAGLPRAVDAYETDGLRRDIAAAPPADSTLELLAPQPGLEIPPFTREAMLRPKALGQTAQAALGALPDPVRADRAQSAYGVRSTGDLIGSDRWLPRPDAVPPRFTLYAQSGLAAHATVSAGRLPAASEEVTTGTKEVEAAATEETARTMRLRAGSVVHLGGDGFGADMTVRITGIVRPRQPEGSYWSADTMLRTPGMGSIPGGEKPSLFWEAGLLLAPGAAPALLGPELAAQPERYWHFAPDTSRLTARDTDALTARVASIEGGPELLRLRRVAGDTATVKTGLEDIVARHVAMRRTIDQLVAVAAFGIGSVAAVVLAMAGGLAVSRRAAELALLRSRGGSLAGIGRRLLGETAVIALPAAAVGLWLAVLAVPEARLLPAVLGASATALLGCAVLPLRAVVRHRTPQTRGGRADLVRARPSRRRTVAELTMLVLAVGSVVALRRRGTADAGDLLVTAAPVLVGLIAAVVLVRLYPLPLRWVARPAGRLRGAIAFLSLARAGRSSATGALPVLALLVALTTAAFGGSVLAGVSDTRDRAATLTTGADARVASRGEVAPLPAGTDRIVRAVPGVREVTPVRVDRMARLYAGGVTQGKGLTVVAVEPQSYARLAGRLGVGAFPAPALGGTGKVVDAIASPDVAQRLGRAPRRLSVQGGDITVRITQVRAHTPAVSGSGFLLVDAARLKPQPPTTLLVTGPVTGPALRTALRERGADLAVDLRTEARAKLTDSPLQKGAARIYAAAVAAGAGYAVIALVLSLLQTSRERATLLARLRTMGLTTRQGRQLLGLEALPQALLAAGGGLLVGWITVQLLAPGIDLARLALAAAPGLATVDDAVLHTDFWSLVLPAVGVVVLAGAVATGQAWWAGRRGSITELRAGDMP